MKTPGLEPYILAVSPTPSVDRDLVITGFQLGQIHRPERVISLAGGKGLNVARAIHRLGGTVKACALLAGYNGHWIAEQLEHEGIGCLAAWAEGETRISTSVIDPTRTGLTEIYERGEPVDLKAWECFEHTLDIACADAIWVTFSGSLPPGVPADRQKNILTAVKERGIPFAVDARGEYLVNSLPVSPEIIKINAIEAGEVLNEEIMSIGQALDAADKLRSLGAQTCIITLGSQGAVAIGPGGGWLGRPPALNAIAAVGSGDSFLGALVLALSRGAELPEALRRGIAAGAANALTIGQAMILPEMVDEIAGQVVIHSQ